MYLNENCVNFGTKLKLLVSAVIEGLSRGLGFGQFPSKKRWGKESHWEKMVGMGIWVSLA